VERVVAEQLDDTRLDDLFDIGVDEVAYRKQHHYLTLIANHDTASMTTSTPPSASIQFHVAQLANKALDAVRRGYWNELRDRAGRDDARRFKHARWALLKRPEDLTDSQHDQLAAIQRAGGEVRRAPTNSKRRYGRSSTPTCPLARPPGCSTASCPGRDDPGWRRSSSCNAPSASIAPASWPRSSSGSTTAGPKA
jgi:transposase